MNQNQLEIMRNGKGFIAALDQSGGSTPKALEAYGINTDSYSGEDEMFDLVHQMRTRIIKSASFNISKILGAILFENTMDREIDGMFTADYIWEEKGIIRFLKIDQGLAQEENGVQLMKPLTKLDELLERAKERNIFGTKMRSVIKTANPQGIKDIVDQQFEVGKKVYEAGFIPILEPEVDINSPSKKEAEEILKAEILKHLNNQTDNMEMIFKLTIPSIDDYFKEIINHENVVRVVALSGGYSRKDANEKLKRNPGLIASFSRALTEGLSTDQSETEFNEILRDSIEEIHLASIV